MRTYSCLIVDDEELIIQRLERFFDGTARAGQPFRLVGKAYSGRKGLEAALELKPDIVVTDIVMPGMNGMEMVETLRERLPSAQFIVLSAYSDFHYTKQAIQNGVTDYIVKVPLDEGSLLEALAKAGSRLAETERKELEVRRLSRSVLESRHRVRKQFLSDFVRGAISPQRAEAYAAQLELPALAGGCFCFVAELGDYAGFRRRYGPSDQSMLKYGLYNLMEETVTSSAIGFVSELEEQLFVGFVAWPDSRSESERERRCRELGGLICDNARRYLKLTVSVGFSPPASGWASMRAAFAQAKAACDDAFYWDAASVVTPSGAFRYEGGGAACESAFDGVVRQLEAGGGAERLTEAIFQAQSQLFERKARREATTACVKAFLEAAKAKIRAWRPALPSCDDQALLYMTLREQLEYVRAYLTDCLAEGGAPYLRPEIAKAKQYIERHITKRLTLQEVADAVNLTPTYFSSLFKKEMSEGLIEYVNRLKINRSLELLQHRDYTNQELCDEVGIVNEGYFCKLFKQVTGESPKQYRKQAIQRARSVGRS